MTSFLAEKILQIFVVDDLYQIPVVQPGPLDSLFGDVKAQGADQMEAAAGRGTGPGNVAAVLWNFRLHKYNVQHCRSPRSFFANGHDPIHTTPIVRQIRHKINEKNQKYNIFFSFHQKELPMAPFLVKFALSVFYFMVKNC